MCVCVCVSVCVCVCVCRSQQEKCILPSTVKKGFEVNVCPQPCMFPATKMKSYGTSPSAQNTNYRDVKYYTIPTEMLVLRNKGVLLNDFTVCSKGMLGSSRG